MPEEVSAVDPSQSSPQPAAGSTRRSARAGAAAAEPCFPSLSGGDQA